MFRTVTALLLCYSFALLLGCTSASEHQLSSSEIPLEPETHKIFCDSYTRPLVLKVEHDNVFLNAERVESSLLVQRVVNIMRTRADKVLHIDDASLSASMNFLRDIHKVAPEVKFRRLPKGFVEPCTSAGVA